MYKMSVLYISGDDKQLMFKSMAMSILKLELSSVGHNKKVSMTDNS